METTTMTASTPAESKATDSTSSRVKRMTLMVGVLAMVITGLGFTTGGSGGGIIDSAYEAVGLETEEASASAYGCTSASRGPVCIQVFGESTNVRGILASRHAHGSICRSSVWMYAVYPSGWVRGLNYQARNNCAYGTGYFYKGWGSGYAYSGLYLPHGTRVCVKWMESGSPVGGEPCITIKR